MALTTKQFDTRQTVYSDNGSVPIIGVDSADGTPVFAPWKWDERIWTHEGYENAEQALVSLADAEIRGIPQDYWLSGVCDLDSDLEILQPVVLRQESQDRWTAQVRHGEYFKYYQKNFLFAQRAITSYVDNTNNVSSRNVLALSSIPNYNSPINASIWSRDILGNINLYRRIEKKTSFTGLYTSEGESLTVINGVIVWANVDTTKHEFVVSFPAGGTTAPTLYFNKDFTFLVGKTTVSTVDDLSFCDYLGEGLGKEDQILYLKYFPVLNNAELVLYSTDGLTFTPMVPWVLGSTPGVYDYMIDRDRGEITFPSEYIRITGATPVSTGINPPMVGKSIYAKYRTTVEVEYEPIDCNNYATLPYIDMNPLHSSVNNGLVYLTEEELRVAYIILTADRSLISENLYGPIYIGSDYCYLIATAYNSKGQPVPGVEISFYLANDTDGLINGASSLVLEPITAITDSAGKARVVYTSPRSIESIGQYITHVSPETANQLILTNTDGIDSSKLSSLYIYQVFNDDVGLSDWDIVNQRGGRKVVLYRKTFAVLPGGGDTTDPTQMLNDPAAVDPKLERVDTDADDYDEFPLGAYMPFRPISITGSDTLTFTDNLPYTQTAIDTQAPGYIPGTSNGNMVAYWVSAGKTIPIHSKCYSYLFNAWVESNEIDFRVELPEFLTGIHLVQDSDPDLIIDREIPYGFRLADTHSAASGIDGATFLSINPRENTYPATWEGISTGVNEVAFPYNSSSYGSLGYKFKVII